MNITSPTAPRAIVLTSLNTVIRQAALSFLAVFALAIAARAQTSLAWSEAFSNNTGINQSLSYVNWSMNYNPTGTAASQGSQYISSGAGSDGTNGAIFWNIGNGSHGANISPSIVWTEKIASSNLSIQDISRVDFSSKNGLSTYNWQVALKINSSWYVSTAVFNDNGLNTAWTPQSMNLSGSTWHALSFTSGTILSEDTESAISLPSSGTLTGIGFFTSVGTDQTGRLDTINVYSAAIPEPSSYAVILSGFMAGVFVLRRRKR